MAWNVGELITASKLNSENWSNYGYFGGTHPDAADWIQNSIGNGGQVYTHIKAGSVFFHMRLDNGWFGGGKFSVRKWVNGGWNETLISTEYGWNTHTDVNIKSTGPGLYKISSDSPFEFAAIPWWVEFGDNDCQVGEHLVEYDKWNASLLPKPGGAPLTVSKLQSGYIGTTH